MKRLIIYIWATVVCFAAYAQTPNVTGRVTSTGGLPIEGVVVSDGLNCTQTDADGRYALTSDLELRRFVFVSVPAEYEIPARHGCPQFFKHIDRFQKEVKADFVLEPRMTPAVHHTLLVQGDPQIKNYGVDGSAEAYRSVVIPDMIRMRSTITTPCYGINLGDLVYNDMNVYNAYIDNTERVNTTTFNVIGNHDHDQTTILSDSLGTVYFEMYLGPTCYSANIGDMHYVFVDNILYGRDDATKSYELGLSDEIAHWLKQDLSYVPKDKTIMICAHSQMFKKHSSFSTRNRNYPVYRDELLKFRNVYSWAGHNHHTYIYNYNRSEEMKIDNLTAVTVTRSTGSLRLNKHLNNDGTPQGYMIVDVNGDDVSWYYHSCGKDRNYQMRLYSPVRSGSDYVLANIWTYDDAWGPVEWWENGVKKGELEPCEELDPDYVDLYATVTDKTTRKYCQPAKSFHMFRIKPGAGVTAGEVRVTDRFGTTYTERVSW